MGQLLSKPSGSLYKNGGFRKGCFFALDPCTTVVVHDTMSSDFDWEAWQKKKCSNSTLIAFVCVGVMNGPWRVISASQKIRRNHCNAIKWHTLKNRKDILLNWQKGGLIHIEKHSCAYTWCISQKLRSILCNKENTYLQYNWYHWYHSHTGFHSYLFLSRKYCVG